MRHSINFELKRQLKIKAKSDNRIRDLLLEFQKKIGFPLHSVKFVPSCDSTGRWEDVAIDIKINLSAPAGK